MDITSFKAKYSHFQDEAEIKAALDDAGLLIDSFNIDPEKRALGLEYLAAHILTLPQGEIEPKVTRVKADTVEVAFSDKAGSDSWLASTSYGQMLLLLIKPQIKRMGVFVV